MRRLRAGAAAVLQARFPIWQLAIIAVTAWWAAELWALVPWPYSLLLYPAGAAVLVWASWRVGGAALERRRSVRRAESAIAKLRRGIWEGR